MAPGMYSAFQCFSVHVVLSFALNICSTYMGGVVYQQNNSVQITSLRKSRACAQCLELCVFHCFSPFKGSIEVSLLTVCLFLRSISESFLTVKGAALFLPRGNGSSTPRISHRRNKHAGNVLCPTAEPCLLTLVSKSTFLEFLLTQ